MNRPVSAELGKCKWFGDRQHRADLASVGTSVRILCAQSRLLAAIRSLLGFVLLVDLAGKPWNAKAVGWLGD